MLFVGVEVKNLSGCNIMRPWTGNTRSQIFVKSIMCDQKVYAKTATNSDGSNIVTKCFQITISIKNFMRGGIKKNLVFNQTPS